MEPTRKLYLKTVVAVAMGWAACATSLILFLVLGLLAADYFELSSHTKDILSVFGSVDIAIIGLFVFAIFLTPWAENKNGWAESKREGGRNPEVSYVDYLSQDAKMGWGLSKTCNPIVLPFMLLWGLLILLKNQCLRLVPTKN